MSSFTNFDAAYLDRITKQSRWVDWWQSYPRMGLGPLSDDSAYIKGAIMLAVPWVVTGCVLFLIAFVLVLVRFTCAKNKYDYHHLSFTGVSKLRRARREIASSVVLMLIIFVAVAFGVLASLWLEESTDYLFTSLRSLVTFFKYYAELTAEFFAFLGAEVGVVDLIGVPPELLPDALQVVNYIQDGADTAGDFTDQVVQLANDADNIIVFVQDLIQIILILLAVVVFIIALTPVVMYFTVETRNSCARIVFATLFILLMALSWILTGAITSVGVVLSDVCVAFDNSLSFLAGNTSDTSFFNEQGLQCLSQINDGVVTEFENVLTEINSVRTAEVLSYILFPLVMSRSDWSIVLGYFANSIGSVINCNSVIAFISEITFFVCGDTGGSSIGAAFGLWVAFLVLSLALTFVIISMMFRFNPLALTTYIVDPLWECSPFTEESRIKALDHGSSGVDDGSAFDEENGDAEKSTKDYEDIGGEERSLGGDDGYGEAPPGDGKEPL